MRDEPSKKEVRDFLKLVAKLEPEEFIGIAKVLGVPLVEKNEGEENVEGAGAIENAPDIPGYSVRAAEDVLEDVIIKHFALSRKGRHNVTSLIKTVVK